MKRRSFLAGLLAFAAAPALPKVPVAAAVATVAKPISSLSGLAADFDGDTVCFAETFYPTMTVTPSDLGHNIDTPLVSISPIKPKPYYQKGRWV